MQKKICRWLMGYILLLVLVGIGLYINRSVSKLPLLEEAVIRDLVPAGVVSGDQEGEPSSEKENTQKPETIDDQSNADYWANYRKDDQLELTKDQLNISATDKLKVLFLIRKNLSGQEINRIFSLAQGGITPQEQSEIKSLLRQRLDTADRTELKKLIYKYL